jgi:uncharacterized membrane protein
MAYRALNGTPDKLDILMQKLSLIVSLVALGVMLGSLLGALGSGTPVTVSTATLPISAFHHIAQTPLWLATMSIGIILLAILPCMRVAAALWLYIRRKKVLDILVALIVLLELLLSMWLEAPR